MSTKWYSECTWQECFLQARCGVVTSCWLLHTNQADSGPAHLPLSLHSLRPLQVTPVLSVGRVRVLRRALADANVVYCVAQVANSGKRCVPCAVSTVNVAAPAHAVRALRACCAADSAMKMFIVKRMVTGKGYKPTGGASSFHNRHRA